uniref:Na(+)/H(+) antiporter NhaA n=1 Tax=Sphingobacterium sp. (strain 21) TaxID=743722 RepID=F4C408_SPHS2
MSKSINLKSFNKFLKSETSGGIILLCCVVISLVIANSPLSQSFELLLNQKIGYSSATLHLNYSISGWINDGLMAVFFLMVGLEIKRELVEGELSSPKKAALPILAALGGVLTPAFIYFLFNNGLPTAKGWGTPMATDIAFAIAIISLLGKRVPASLRIFLAALAIVDDLMAILVIAIFYTSEIHFVNLAYAGAFWTLLIIFNKIGIKKLAFYLIPAVFIWYFIHHSGIHATIAGVLTALTLPTTPNAKESPLEKLEHILFKPVNFLIMPLFALSNTNIRFENGMTDGLISPLGLGIILGLVIGKPLGITFFSWFSTKIGIAKLPSGSKWKHIFGAGILGGIGFTMSIFVAILSFSQDATLLAEAKFAILSASLLAGTTGAIYLILVDKRTSKKPTSILTNSTEKEQETAEAVGTPNLIPQSTL